MEFPVKKEKTIEDKLKEYVELQQRIKLETLDLEALKADIDNNIQEDSLVLEGVAVFKRKKSFFRSSLDKTKVEERLSPDDFKACFKTTEVKGSIEIMSWQNMLAKKQMLDSKKSGTEEQK
jgi:hypothetical protein